MKTRAAASLFLTAWLATRVLATGEELPMFGQLPKLNERWRVREQGKNDASPITLSWIVLTNSQSGDMLSFAAQKIVGRKGLLKVNRAWSDAAADMFPGGYPAWNKPLDQSFGVHWIRNEVVQLSTVNGAIGKTIKRQTEVSILEQGFVIIISRRFPEAVVRSRFAPDFIRRSAYSNVIQGVNEEWNRPFRL